MTEPQLLAVLEQYDGLLAAMGVEAIEHDHTLTCQSEAAALQHVRSMIPTMRGFVAEGDQRRVDRWLGWAQGVLWVAGVFTLAEERDHNR